MSAERAIITAAAISSVGVVAAAIINSGTVLAIAVGVLVIGGLTFAAWRLAS